uniref:Uncharacterized protein n=1 Tax=Xenopus tropicalis TaxID=8364 RepID=A0A1B8Y1D6_XENTR|eukprot:XP_004917680.1 PREDICTED: uncharacterized protein LOC101732464 [Xenopus tropicalis]
MNYLEDTSPCPLSEEESRLAYGAKQRALDILVDALRKQDSVLVENAGEYGHSVGRRPSLSPHLVLSLRAELERVTFVKVAHPFYAICYIYPRSHERIIYLGPRFWKQGQFLGADSRPGLLIKKAAQFLLHQTPGAVPAEHGTVVQGQRHEALSANQIRREFETVLNHQGRKTAQDSVCEDPYSRSWLLRNTPRGLLLLSNKERKVAEETKQRTLRILLNAVEKRDSHVMEKPEDFFGGQRLKNCPLTPPRLVQDVVIKLQKVTVLGNQTECTIIYIYIIYTQP